MDTIELLVLRSDPPRFDRRGAICRLCLKRLQHSVVLRPKRLRLDRNQIERSSLEGWLKHDFAFFGESYVCGSCAKRKGFV
jgi:hypothetical protein